MLRGVHHAGDTANRKQRDKANPEIHRGREADGPLGHRRHPIEYLDSRRDPDQQGREREDTIGDWPHPHREQVVRPYSEAEHADEDPRVHHHRVSEQRLAGRNKVFQWRNQILLVDVVHRFPRGAHAG